MKNVERGRRLARVPPFHMVNEMRSPLVKLARAACMAEKLSKKDGNEELERIAEKLYGLAGTLEANGGDSIKEKGERILAEVDLEELRQLAESVLATEEIKTEEITFQLAGVGKFHIFRRLKLTGELNRSGALIGMCKLIIEATDELLKR